MKEFKSIYQREREKLESEDRIRVSSQEQSFEIISDISTEMHSRAHREKTRKRAVTQDLTQVTLNA